MASQIGVITNLGYGGEIEDLPTFGYAIQVNLQIFGAFVDVDLLDPQAFTSGILTDTDVIGTIDAEEESTESTVSSLKITRSGIYGVNSAETSNFSFNDCAITQFSVDNSHFSGVYGFNNATESDLTEVLTEESKI